MKSSKDMIVTTPTPCANQKMIMAKRLWACNFILSGSVYISSKLGHFHYEVNLGYSQTRIMQNFFAMQTYQL